MSEEAPTPEDLIKKIIEESGTAGPQNDEERISKIISQTRRNVGTRDFIILVLVRFWMVLAEFFCKVFARQPIDTDINPTKKKVKPENGQT